MWLVGLSEVLEHVLNTKNDEKAHTTATRSVFLQLCFLLGLIKLVLTTNYCIVCVSFVCIVYMCLCLFVHIFPGVSLHDRRLQSEAASIGSRRQPEQNGASPLTALQAETQLCSTEGKHS